jgi:hypothetical protein
MAATGRFQSLVNLENAVTHCVTLRGIDGGAVCGAQDGTEFRLRKALTLGAAREKSVG